MISSLLDTDLYKFTMQQAVRACELSRDVSYSLIQRGRPISFSTELVKRLETNIENLATLQFSAEEIAYLNDTTLFAPDYLKWLQNYQFNFKQVNISSNDDGNLSVSVHGPWVETILWEVPLLAVISETAHEIMDGAPPMLSFCKSNAVKGQRIAEWDLSVVDFGTRRRRSLIAQTAMLEILKKETAGATQIGTSNVHLARILGLNPSGTIAHEWIMAHGCMYGETKADSKALRNWLTVYDKNITIALSDTYTLKHFLNTVEPEILHDIAGIRHDSGDPFDFADRTIQHLESMGADPKSKKLVFSNGLNLDAIQAIEKFVGGRAQTSYGIGTNLTNDFGDAMPFDIVIKLTEFDGKPAVKLTDEPEKSVGKSTRVQEVLAKIKGRK